MSHVPMVGSKPPKSSSSAHRNHGSNWKAPIVPAQIRVLAFGDQLLPRGAE